jgi:large exoprotein involved in heme utilization and adhesion
VTVRATNITLEGATPDNSFLSGLFASAEGDAAGAGNAGDIVVEATYLRLSGGAQIISATFGPGNGGTVTVRATEVTLEGVAPDNRFPSGIFASAEGDAAGAGNAGDIVVEATYLRLSGGAQISSGTFGPGNGGTVTVTATDTIAIAGQNSGIFANATGDGQGGDMTLHGSQLLLTDGATISAQSSGQGNAGTIQIAVSDLTLHDHSVVTTEATQAGGGNIEIEAQTVSLLDSDITATVGGGKGSGGNILIGGTITDPGDITTGVERLTLEGSRITANTDAGDGANIAIGVQQAILDSSSAIVANTDAGIGGNVTIAGTVATNGQAVTRAEAIVLRDSRITAKADEGKGGRIDIVAEAVLADPDSEIDASSQAGIDGEVNIEAVSTNLSEIVTPLSPRFTQTATLLSDPCASRLQRGIVSSFVARGRASVPATPDGLLPSRLYSRAIDPAEPESAGAREALALNSHARLSRRPCP